MGRSSVKKAKGSARSQISPSAVVMRYLYRSPGCGSGEVSTQTPQSSRCIGQGFQALKSPIRETAFACGA